MTSQEVVQRTPQQEVVAQIRSDGFREQVALALPDNVTPERFARIAITALQASPQIVECENASIIRSLLQSAAMGLMPDGREAALVPYKGKAQLIPMIAGYRKIAGDFGWTIYTAIAYEKDEFEYEQGLDVRFRHKPVRPGTPRGEAIAAYAVGKHQDGRRELEVLTVEEVEKVRAVSHAGQKQDAPWVQWWEQMAEKTAGKRLFKKLPLSEDDKRVRIIRASLEPADAAAALYGPQARAALEPGEAVDLQTGEITPAAEPSPAANGSEDGGGRPAVPSGSQQAEGADPDGAQASSSPPVPSAPDDDPEPGAQAAPAAVVVPGGTHAGKTIAEIAAMGEQGGRWLSWAMRHPESPNVGAEFHAALMAYFEAA
jgi:recombination protein RecT